MDKLKMETMDITQENVEKIRNLFPSAVSEVIGEDGKVKLAIDFDVLKQELSSSIINDKQERYQMTWPDKKKSILLANSKVNATLRPDRAKSVDFDNTQNLYIEGDNLDVLKLLRETYLGKIKMIYIDPPYNTGNDFVYKDKFASSAEEYLSQSGQYDDEGNRLVKNLSSDGRYHTDWLNMMYTRLRVARDLLDKDGVVFISIDNNEVFNLGKICDEVFGEENFITNFAVENNPKGRKNNAFVSESYEYCFVYAKEKSFIYENCIDPNIKKFFVGMDVENDCRKVLTDKVGPFVQSKRQVVGINKSNALAANSKEERCFVIYYHEKNGIESIRMINEYDKTTDEWVVSEEGKLLLKENYTRYCCYNSLNNKPAVPLYSKETIKKLFDNNSLYFKKDGTVYEKERDQKQQITSLITNKKYGLDLMTESATTKMETLMGKKDIFPSSKAVDFIKALVKLYPNKHIKVLDFFSGSGTTAHAVMKLNAEDGGSRKFIMVQLPEVCDEKSEAYKSGYKTICEIGEERIRRAGTKIKGEYPEAINLDIGFRVLKLDSSNMQDVYYNPKVMKQSLLDNTVDNIKEDRTPEDLLFQVMLDLGIDLSSKIEVKIINGKNVYYVNDNDIVACFDDNLTNDVIVEIAKLEPMYAVFKDKSFATDSVGINNEQLFKIYAKDKTTIKVL